MEETILESTAATLRDATIRIRVLRRRVDSLEDEIHYWVDRLEDAHKDRDRAWATAYPNLEVPAL